MAGYVYRGGAAPTPPRRVYKKVPECGTPSGYSRHKRLGEPVDDACRDAMKADSRARRARKKAS